MKHRPYASALFPCLVAGGVTLVHPLIYDDSYFNINRFKSAIYLYAAGVCLFVYLVLRLLRGRSPFCRPKLPGIFMAAFLLFAGLSCVLSEWPDQAFTGQNGRLCGLLFLMAVCAMFLITSGAPNAGRYAVCGLLVSGLLCASLALLNFFGLDPLLFTPRMKKSDLEDFISTIGNLDFFGAFLCLALPASAALFARLSPSSPDQARMAFLVNRDSKTACAKVSHRLPGAVAGVNLVLCPAACVAARADCALIGILFAVFTLIFSGARRRKRMCAGLSLLLLGLTVFSVLLRLLPNHHFPLNGQNGAYLVKAPYLTGAFSLLLFLLSLIPRRIARISPRLWIRAWAGFLLLFLIFGAAAFVRFSFFDLETELNGPVALLRFGEHWGTHRGGVWVRCVRLYAESDLRVQLLGFGPDCLKAPLAERFGKEIAELTRLSFNNAHNEILQYLLTQGALGLLSYLALVGSAVCTLKKRAPRDAFSAAQLAGTLAYFACSLVNINQPITTPLFFMLMTAGVWANEAEAYDPLPENP